MPFNGTGLFVRVRNWVADATAGIRIRADYHDIEDDGFADGLSQCIARDGQSVILNNIPMNGKRLTGLQDPTDPQDAVTKAYDDLKLPLTGGTITGNLIINGGLTTTGGITAIGYKTRAGLSGAYGGNWFNFNWTGSNLQVWVDNTDIGDLATTAYVEDRAAAWAHAVADPKVNRSGDHITGGLIVDGELVAGTNYIRFTTPGSGGYINWTGGGNYTCSAGTLWHTGNLDPVRDVRLTNAGTQTISVSSLFEPYGGAVITGLGMHVSGTGQIVKWRYVQLFRQDGNWYTVGYNG